MEKQAENTSGVSSSDSDSIDETDDVNQGNLGRQKRSIPWCRVAPGAPSSSSRPQITWPPASTSSQSWRQLRPARIGNPLYGTKMQLFSKTNHHLAVYPDGAVRGTQDENDLHTFLEVISAGHPGHVRIKGLLTNLYVAMDKKGRLYGEIAMFEENRFGNHVRLFSENGYNLTIRENGEILGLPHDDDPDCLLEIISAGAVGEVRLKSLQNGLYLCFDSNGNLFGQSNENDEGTVFLEEFQGSYTAFKSKCYENWYVGIKKTGERKNGIKTGYGQKAIKFLPRRIEQ